MKSLFMGLGALLLSVGSATGQGIAVRVGRLFEADGLTSYQLTWDADLAGPIGTQLGGLLLTGPGSSERRMGLAVDATLFRGGQPGLYAVGGVGAGAVQGGLSRWWRTWSAGIGFEVIPVPLVSLGVEARWRSLLPEQWQGGELSLRLGAGFSSGRSTRASKGDSDPVSPPRPATSVPRTSEPVTTSAVEAEVIEIAESKVGTPYRFGGTSDSGFDCSGLIQHAYQSVGIELPRRSVEQARAGREVGKARELLRPGDILTFAERGSRITHVGLYMGDGRFIHSASRGVQISRLDDDDPYGRWWYRRWVGARRVLPEG